MPGDLPAVFTIASDKPFLEVLARAVLSGFPRRPGIPPTPLELPRWTILLPTRRAVRELEQVFFALTGGKGLLLPAIRPIGDIDEDLPEFQDSADAAIPATGQVLLLIDLIDDWARENPQSRLAQEIASAPHQTHALALSLKEFLDGLETEEADAARIPELFGIEAARHREAILEFLAIARVQYPARLAEQGRVSQAVRRSQLLRHEAHRLRTRITGGPIIAAGSTGSIPATRDLLKAIAALENGAVVLPGLDLSMDAESWKAVAAPHPQFILKTLLQDIGMPRDRVTPLTGGDAGDRSWLASEVMRPSETSDGWSEALTPQRDAISRAMAAVEMVEASNAQEQALIIALMLRQALDTPGATASLITPDRHLARRVKTELLRWSITIDDSAGEPLLRFGSAALLHLLIEAADNGFDLARLQALLRHPQCLLGREPGLARRCASIIELAALRGQPQPVTLADIPKRVEALLAEERPRLHMALRRLPREDIEAAGTMARNLVAALEPLTRPGGQTLGDHLDQIFAASVALAGEGFWEGPAGEAVAEVRATLAAEAPLLRQCSFARAAAILRHELASRALRPPNPRGSRLTILGLLEARLIRPDLIVLGGLNEGIWPGLPDAGPWLNRPMRDRLGMQQPERAIGQTAHDFVQAFGAADVKLVWSKRLDDAPAIPSRWILRLKMILKASGLEGPDPTHSLWHDIARALSEPATVTPHPKPRPRPPVAARPTSLSVTRIETLIRDPYAIYGRHILQLEPVPPVSAALDMSDRGVIIHNTIADFLTLYPLALPPAAVEELVRIGQGHFDSIKDDPAAISFWWPRFLRIAQWLVDLEKAERGNLRRIVTEQSGAIDLDIGGTTFRLTCRADRIDLLGDGTARITDYKTGTVPSWTQVEKGISPQLTLEAAIAAAGGFASIGHVTVSEIRYVKLGGGDPAGEVRQGRDDTNVVELAQHHISRLVELLRGYNSPAQAYLPRTLIEREDDTSDYDHLSRAREWSLSGEAS